MVRYGLDLPLSILLLKRIATSVGDQESREDFINNPESQVKYLRGSNST